MSNKCTEAELPAVTLKDESARQRWELCPSKGGALKRTDTSGWAHVVCALYIPEVRFGDVATMEPILVSIVPPDRFSKVSSAEAVLCVLFTPLVGRDFRYYISGLISTVLSS